MGKLGDLLRAARETKGLSLEQVEQKTRIRVKLLQALEQEAFDELPAPVFVKGFLRNYALLLGVDVEEALGLYREAAGDIDQPYELHALQEPLEHKPSRLSGFLGGTALVALLAVASWIFLQQGWVAIPDLRSLLAGTATPTQTTRPTATSTQTWTIAPSATSTGTHTRTATAPVRATASVTITAAPTETPHMPTSSPTSSATASPSVTATATATATATRTPTGTSTPTLLLFTSGIHVQLQISEDVWLRVYTDGAKVFEGLAEKGTSKSFVGEAQVYVHCGIGNAVSAIANGNEYGLLDQGRDTVRVEWTLAPGTPSVVSSIMPTQIVLPTGTATPTPRR